MFKYICTDKLALRDAKIALPKKSLPENDVRPVEIITADSIKSVIPLDIYQVWHDLDLPPSVRESTQLVRDQNPEFSHHVYTERTCRIFIKRYFDKQVLKAYDTLIPHAFKADLWRYCVLYKMGGIYLDSKFYGVDGFKLLSLTDKDYFARDVAYFGIYNAIIACKAGNPILLNCINKVVENTRSKFYGTCGVCPTGPLMIMEFFPEKEHAKLRLEVEITFDKKRYIRLDGRRILKYHEDYHAQRTSSWGTQWYKKQIYKR